MPEPIRLYALPPRVPRRAGALSKLMLPALIFLLQLRSEAAHGFEMLDKRPCTIAYNRGLPVHMDCLVRSSMSQGVLVEIVRTPDGKTFRIENTSADIDKWFVNRKRAIKSGTEARPCYTISQIEICFH
jgi:hypothetical protein